MGALIKVLIAFSRFLLKILSNYIRQSILISVRKKMRKSAEESFEDILDDLKEPDEDNKENDIGD